MTDNRESSNMLQTMSNQIKVVSICAFSFWKHRCTIKYGVKHHWLLKQWISFIQDIIFWPKKKRKTFCEKTELFCSPLPECHREWRICWHLSQCSGFWQDAQLPGWTHCHWRQPLGSWRSVQSSLMSPQTPKTELKIQMQHADYCCSAQSMYIMEKSHMYTIAYPALWRHRL